MKALLLLALLAAASAQSCSHTFSAQGVSFDLSPLSSTTGYWQADEDDTRDFDYYFNFCSAIAPPTVNPPNLCNITNAPDANFYQFVNDSAHPGAFSRCYVISRASSVQWALIDEADPALGVVQWYRGGSTCADGSQRDINVTFVCSPVHTQPEFENIYEDEDTVCDYSLVVRSMYACPRECPIDNGRTCGGRGLCGFDADSTSVRCFCNNGRAGVQCDKDDDRATTSSGKATSVLAAFVIIILIALVVLAILIFRKMKKLQVDEGRYSTLQAEPETAARSVVPEPVASAAP